MLGLWLCPKWWIYSAKGRKTFTGQQWKQNLESGHCILSSCLPMYRQVSLGLCHCFVTALLRLGECSTSQPPPTLRWMQDGVSSWSTRKPRQNGCIKQNSENWQRRCHCNSDCHFIHSSIWYPKRHLLGIFIQLKGLTLIVVGLYLDSPCLPEAQYHDVVADSFGADNSDLWETRLSYPWAPMALSPPPESPATPRFPRAHPQAKHAPMAGPHPGTSSCTPPATHSLGRTLWGTRSAGAALKDKEGHMAIVNTLRRPRVVPFVGTKGQTGWCCSRSLVQ